jgi:2-dehydropantoate 2-reductase
MDTENPRLLIIGAGVNGSICATAFYRAGIDVTILARGKRYEEIISQGIIIEDPFKNQRTITRVPVIQSLDPDDNYEYILVIIRKNQIPELLPVLAKNRSPNIVFMVNNPSGPEIYTDALNKERILLGFVFGAGKRDGSIIRAFSVKGGSSPFGELDGTITPRLTRLIGIFRTAGFHAITSTDITDYLSTHAAMVAPLARLLIKNNSDNYALSRSKQDLSLLIDAFRETMEVLTANGIKIIPQRTGNILKKTPKFILRTGMGLLLSTRYTEVGAAWHCQQAPDEMRQLGIELMALVVKSGLPAPALRQIFSTESFG